MSKADPVADWTRLDESPAASAQMIQWHAPETAAALAPPMPTLDEILAAIDHYKPSNENTPYGSALRDAKAAVRETFESR